MGLRVVSYNVRYAGLDDGERAWERRRDAVASVLRFHRPDVAALQEVWRGQLDDLAERLPALSWVERRNLGGAHTPIGHRSRVEAVDAGCFPPTPDPDEPTAPGWDAALPRFTTWATLRVAGGRLTVYSTHLDHEGERARREGARLLADRVGTHDHPTVVAGDLNCGPGDPAYETLLDAGLRDARRVADEPPHGPRETFNDFAGPEEALDHVLVTDGVDVARHGVLTDLGPGGWYPSDHFPVVVDLGVP